METGQGKNINWGVDFDYMKLSKGTYVDFSNMNLQELLRVHVKVCIYIIIIHRTTITSTLQHYYSFTTIYTAAFVYCYLGL